MTLANVADVADVAKWNSLHGIYAPKPIKTVLIIKILHFWLIITRLVNASNHRSVQLTVWQLSCLLIHQYAWANDFTFDAIWMVELSILDESVVFSQYEWVAWGFFFFFLVLCSHFVHLFSLPLSLYSAFTPFNTPCQYGFWQMVRHLQNVPCISGKCVCECVCSWHVSISN